jgi:hypothetical protein
VYITPGQTRDSCRDAEHYGEALVDVDAEQSNCFTVGHAGTHDHTEGGELQEGEDRGNDDHAAKAK